MKEGAGKKLEENRSEEAGTLLRSPSRKSEIVVSQPCIKIDLYLLVPMYEYDGLYRFSPLDFFFRC